LEMWMRDVLTMVVSSEHKKSDSHNLEEQR
jgi:hypothetical protein